MHDSLGHALVSIAIKLEAVQRLYAVDVERASAEMEETKALVRSTMADLRSSLAGLRPAALEEQPLSGALAEMTREMGRRSGVEATCTVDEQVALLDRAVQETLYRVGQEALTNVAKHARAQRVAVKLAVQGSAVVLEVSDNGVGLDAVQRNGAGHYGILGMRERVEALGGRLTLGPLPEGGTVLRATVPAGEVM
jgi:signal transduction histidine kinase